jgi:hypothetical protein
MEEAQTDQIEVIVDNDGQFRKNKELLMQETYRKEKV